MTGAAIDAARRWFDLPSRGAGARLAGLAFGDTGRPLDVLFLHANGFNARTYRAVLSDLPELHVLAIDLRGHGRSAGWPDVTSWYDLRDDILALLPQVTARPVVLAGHSMGGATALLAAAARPDLTRALALFDPVLPSQSALAMRGESGATNPLAEGALRRRNAFASREEAFGRMVGRGIFATWPQVALRDYLADGLREDGTGGYVLSCAPTSEAANFAAFGYDPLVAIAALRAPATVLRAASGSTCTIEEHPALTIDTIAGTTHFLPLERPDLVRRTLRAACRI